MIDPCQGSHPYEIPFAKEPPFWLMKNETKQNKNKKNIQPTLRRAADLLYDSENQDASLSNNQWESDTCKIGQPTFNTYPTRDGHHGTHQIGSSPPTASEALKKKKKNTLTQNRNFCRLDSQTYKTKIYLFIFLIQTFPYFSRLESLSTTLLIASQFPFPISLPL